ncbi:unnamed protein product [Bubo scandiacus]
MELGSSRCPQKGHQSQIATGSILVGHKEENLQRKSSLACDEIVWRGNTIFILGYIPNSPAQGLVACPVYLEKENGNMALEGQTASLHKHAPSKWTQSSPISKTSSVPAREL